MTNIVQLPDSFERQWRVYEGQLRAHYSQQGATLDEVEYALVRLKPIYLDAASMNFTSFATGDVMMRELNTWVNKQVFTMMTYIAVRDVELYRLRGEG